MEALVKKFNEILGWERRKRREQTLAMIGCVTFAFAIVFLPLNGFLPRDWLRWTVPGILFVLLAPWFFYRAKWRQQHSARAVAALDKELRLAECAVTAWESPAVLSLAVRSFWFCSEQRLRCAISQRGKSCHVP